MINLTTKNFLSLSLEKACFPHDVKEIYSFIKEQGIRVPACPYTHTIGLHNDNYLWLIPEITQQENNNNIVLNRIKSFKYLLGLFINKGIDGPIYILYYDMQLSTIRYMHAHVVSIEYLMKDYMRNKCTSNTIINVFAYLNEQINLPQTKRHNNNDVRRIQKLIKFYNERK